jgi:class 3 adenylate cyclase
VEFIQGKSFGRHRFDVRVGINSGPLVAGIVGVKKFAYDIWGDTVNMASRMESNSESGRVNISENTHALVLNDFTFTYRGKINAKNKGEVDMYFVDHEVTNPEQ